MRKVKGYDIFILASKGSLAVVEFRVKEGVSWRGKQGGKNSSSRSINLDNDGPEKEFVVLNHFENLFNSYIYEVAIFNDLLIPVSLGGKDETLKVIKLNVKDTKSININEGEKSQRTLRGGNTNRSQKSGQKHV
jgi:hypothetical protein